MRSGPAPKPRIGTGRATFSCFAPLGAHHHHGGGAVGDQAAVVAAQRLDDEARLAVLLERERLAQLRVRIGRAVPAAGDGDRAQPVGRRAVLLHVALRDHRIAGRRAEPAVDGAVVVAVRLLVGLARAGGRVVGQRHHGDVALAGVDRHRGLADHADVAGAAMVPDAADPRLQRHRLGKLLCVHHLEARGRRLDEQRRRPAACRRRRRPAPCGSPRR